MILRNARSSAEPFRAVGLRLALLKTGRSVADTRVRRSFQSLPAIPRDPAICGRLCVSPMHPSAPFPQLPHRSNIVAKCNCCGFASGQPPIELTGVTNWKQKRNLNSIKRLPKGAKNESSKTNSIHHGIGVRGGHGFIVQPSRDNLSVGLFNGLATSALNLLPLTTFKWLPVRIAPWGHFVVSNKTKKDSPCSEKS
ncbi:hypothetical protein [Marinovum sp. KMM 9879]